MIRELDWPKVCTFCWTQVAVNMPYVLLASGQIGNQKNWHMMNVVSSRPEERHIYWLGPIRNTQRNVRLCHKSARMTSWRKGRNVCWVIASFLNLPSRYVYPCKPNLFYFYFFMEKVTVPTERPVTLRHGAHGTNRWPKKGVKCRLGPEVLFTL